MNSKKKELTRISIYLLWFIGIGMLANRNYLSSVLRPDYVFIAAVFAWEISIDRRIVRPKLRRILLVIAYLLVMLLMLRLFKYNLAVTDTFMHRMLWYMYYIPTTVIPMLSLLGALYLGKSDDEKISPNWQLLWIPTILLMVGVLTNDFHQLAFHFNSFPFSESDYSHGIIWAFNTLWSYALAIVSCIIMAVKSARRLRTRTFLLTIAAPLAATIYFAAYLFAEDTITKYMEYPEMYCFFVISVWEGLIVSGIIPSNSGYEMYFDNSSLPAQIVDNFERPVYTSRNFAKIDKSRYVVREHAISGGKVYIAEDISEISSLRRQLEEISARLQGESELLRAENSLLEDEHKIMAHNTIYDEARESVRPQLARVEELIAIAENDVARFEECMTVACLFTVYIKRKSNLTIKKMSENLISIHDLEICVGESLKYLAWMGIATFVSCDSDAVVNIDTIIELYDDFERILEDKLDGLTGITVAIKENADDIELRIVTEGKETEYNSVFCMKGGDRQ